MSQQRVKTSTFTIDWAHNRNEFGFLLGEEPGEESDWAGIQRRKNSITWLDKPNPHNMNVFFKAVFFVIQKKQNVEKIVNT